MQTAITIGHLQTWYQWQATTYSIALTTLKEFWAIGPPVILLPMYVCSLELSAPLILFVGLLQTLFTSQVAVRTCSEAIDTAVVQRPQDGTGPNIEDIDSSIVLLVAGSGLAEPGVDILVQQQAWPSWISVGANHFWERGKREDPTCWIRFVPRATNYA